MSAERSISNLLSAVEISVARILDRSLNGGDISVEDGIALLRCNGLEMNALVAVADQLRRERVGDVVTYVVNRNINFTNVCIKRCGFCAFSRDFRQEEGYFLPISEVIRRAKEAWDLGATEVCIQAGLPPKMKGDLYLRICEAIKSELPDIHIHGFSPEEVLYGSVRSKCSTRDYLKALKVAGVGSLPGTSAEILDDSLRERISGGRISTEQWIEIVTTAHELGIPTTCTMMYGHVETEADIAKHIALLRDIQKGSGGFTEFVPLSFVHYEAPMVRLGLIDDVRHGPTGTEVIKVHAVARLMLNNWIPNLQVAWVKEGPRFGQMLLAAGVNDLGGTLINESISNAAGSQHGQALTPSKLREMARGAGRIPAERGTTYEILREFADPINDPADPLDQYYTEAENRFGSYFEMIRSENYRFVHPEGEPVSSAQDQ